MILQHYMVTGEILRVHPAPETLWLFNSLHVTALAPAAALNFQECGLTAVVTHQMSLGVARRIGQHVFSPGSTGCLTNNGASHSGNHGKYSRCWLPESLEQTVKVISLRHQRRLMDDVQWCSCDSSELPSTHFPT